MGDIVQIPDSGYLRSIPAYRPVHAGVVGIDDNN